MHRRRSSRLRTPRAKNVQSSKSVRSSAHTRKGAFITTRYSTRGDRETVIRRFHTEGRSPGRYFRRARNERPLKKRGDRDREWLTERTSMQNSISTAGWKGDRRALIGAYATSFTVHVPALLRANRLYFLRCKRVRGNDTKSGIEKPTRTTRRLSTYRCLPPRDARGVFAEQKWRQNLAICFLPIDNTEKLTVRLRESNSMTRSLYAREREREKENALFLYPAIFLINPRPISKIWN